MAKRRGAFHVGRGSPTSNTTFILGLTCGVALGALATFTLFSWLPQVPELPGTARSITAKGLRTSDRDSLQQEYSKVSLQNVQSSTQDTDHGRMPSFDPVSPVPGTAKDSVTTLAVKPGNITQATTEGEHVISNIERPGAWRLSLDVLEIAKQYPKAQIISHANPVIILLKQFLSLDESEHMVRLASTHMARSKVVADVEKKKEEAVSKVRTSYGAWLSRQWRDSLVEKIEKRVHDAVGIPREFGEGIYVLRYEKDQKYDPHTDNCAKKGEIPRKACVDFLKRSKGPNCGTGFGGASCGDRIATVIMYLRSPEVGGETVFPSASISKQRLAQANHTSLTSHGPSWYCNDPNVLKVSADPGDAVLFWDYVPRPDIINHMDYPRSGAHENNTMDTEAINDPSALHGGCPVTKGEKWIATRWIRSSQFV